MRVRDVLARVLGEAGAAPVETDLRPSQVVGRVRRRRRVTLAWRSVAATATTVAVVAAAFLIPRAVDNPQPDPPPIASDSQSDTPGPSDRQTKAPKPPATSPHGHSQTTAPDDPGPTSSEETRTESTPAEEDQPASPPLDGQEEPSAPPSILNEPGSPHASWDTAPEGGPGTATGKDPASLADIEVARHDTYDRVVFEFSGDIRPGYEISYGEVDEPGSGRAVDLAGSRSLAVIFHNAARQSEDTYEGPTTLTPSLSSIAQIKYLGGFEGVTHAGVGVDAGSQAPFRVITLESPSRIVIDVAHTSGR